MTSIHSLTYKQLIKIGTADFLGQNMLFSKAKCFRCDHVVDTISQQSKCIIICPQKL